MPGGLRVRLVTVRLLTFEECLVVRRFAAAGRTALAHQFAQDHSRHISTNRHFAAPPPPIHMHSGIGGAAGRPHVARGEPGGDAKGGDNADAFVTPRAPGRGLAAGRPASEPTGVVPQPVAGPSNPPAGAPPTPAPPLPAGPLNSPSLPPGPLAKLTVETVSWDADRLRDKLVELKVPIPVANRPAAIDATTVPAGPLTSVFLPVLRLLPPYDEKAYQPDVSPAVLFPAFAKPALLSQAMCMLDMRLRVLSAAPVPIAWAAVSAAIGLAKHVVNTLHTQTQVAGWTHFEVGLSFFFMCEAI